MDLRPSPESLLREFGSAPKLTIYLASAPGAGKTRRLLEDAIRLQEAGRRVALGWVETKERPDLDALVARLPRIPVREFRVGDATFTDFDFAATVAAAPEHVVLDEAAHTNLPGGAHEKRWQDALALRAAGISVLTALNVQHIESVAAAAESLIGFPVREIVPLSFVRAADQVVALDVTPEQIERRLRAGAIVRSEDVGRALGSNIFRPQTLRYLREMMLRIVDDVTIPDVSPRQVSTALAIVTSDRDVDIATFARKAGTVARALDLALELAYVGAHDGDAFAAAARDNDARVIPLENFDLARPQLDALKAALVVVPAGPLAMRLAGTILDRDLYIVDSASAATKEDLDLDGMPYGQTAGDRMRIGYGRLTIYLGAAAGSGKTYAMLDRAHQLRDEGIDVVGGYIEPHARPETRKKMEGLEILPRRIDLCDGTTSTELDLTAVLERKPAIALIDELAHTNPSCEAHAKRYDDVLQVLRAGISVMTTLNVQHLEGLGDAVYRLTKQRIRETVPDAIMELADDVILIDATPEILRERLRAGKIYPADRIEPALANFFRTENLAALRELALREVLKARAPAQPRAFARLAVGVKARERDIALIERCARLAMRLEIELSVIHIERPGAPASRIVETLQSTAQRVRARWRVATGDPVSGALVRAAIEEEATAIAIEGARTRARWPLSSTPLAKRLLEAGARQVLVLAPVG